MKRMTAIVLACALSLLPACGAAVPTLPQEEMNFALVDSADIAVRDFNLGEGDMKTTGGEPMPCPLDGILAVPAGDQKCPVVVAIHGYHADCDIYKDQNYRGFDYLVRQMAAEGYLALSVNMNLEYNDYLYGGSEDFAFAKAVVRQHLQALARANAGEDAGFGVDLTGRADMDNIHLVGHSRGCNVSMAVAADDPRIKSVVLGAAAWFDQTPPDVPMGVICVQNDEDVRGAAYQVFDAAKANPARSAPAHLAYLLGGSHAYFNRKMPDLSGSKATLTRAQQEDFFTRYVCAFLSIYAKGQPPFSSFDPTQPQPAKLFGCDAVCSFWQPGTREIYVPTEENVQQLRHDRRGRLGWDYEEQTNTPGPIYHPGGPDPRYEDDTRVLPLLGCFWLKKGAALWFPCKLKADDRAISFYISSGIIHEQAAEADPDRETFSVALRTKDGHVRRVVIPKEAPALQKRPFTNETEEWGDDRREPYTETPLAELRVPLRLFAGVDLRDVTEVSLRFDQSKKGVLWLAGVFVG